MTERRADVTYQVSKLERGTVLDHLKAGTALRAVQVLALPADITVMVGIRLPSARHAHKDIIKIENYELTSAQAAKVALISAATTLSIIRDYKVVEKHDLAPPKRFRGLIRCVNPGCIVHGERMVGSFTVENDDPIRVRCDYCERSITADQFEFE